MKAGVIRKGLISVITMACAVALAACSGNTTTATNVTGVSATLNAQASCAGGKPTPCSYYFKYGTGGEYQFRTPVTGPANANGQNLPVSEKVTGLAPNTGYQYQFCGKGDDVTSFVCVGPSASVSAQDFVTATRSDCIYTRESQSELQSFEQMVGHDFECMMTFNNANPTWANWENPWFLNEPAGNDLDVKSWLNADPNRRIIVTQQMFASDAGDSGDTASGPGTGIQKCAAGDDNGYAQALAQNLIADGAGNSIIRLGHESNDTGSAYAVYPSWTQAQFAQWDACWDNLVAAMRSVTGAHFLFDWTINAYWQPIPLASWYPGDQYANIIGIDAYDAGLPAGTECPDGAWTRVYTQQDGIEDVLNFAAQHDKPVSFPEWGIEPTSATGCGDDPYYINHLAAVMSSSPVAYQSYFLAGDSGTLLLNDSGSLGAYTSHFGGAGDLANSTPFTS